MSDTQSRFIEDCSRFDQPTTPTRRKLADVPPSHGNQSSDPGPWLPETIADAWMSRNEPRTPNANAQYANAVAIRDAFPVRLSVGTIPRELPDSSPAFKYLDTPNVLSGQRLQAHLRTHKSLVSLSLLESEDISDDPDTDYTAEELAVIKAKRAAERKVEPENKKTAKVGTIAQSLRSSSSDEALDRSYAVWFERPSQHNADLFFGTLLAFVLRKSRYLTADDNLRQRGFTDDVASEFVITMTPRLRAQQTTGTRIAVPHKYLARAWDHFCNDQRARLQTDDSRTIQIDVPPTNAEDGDEEDSLSLGDREQVKAWIIRERLDNDPFAQSVEELAEVRKRKLEILDSALRDIAEMFIAQMSQGEMAKKLGISQQAVSKRLKKATKALQLA